VINRRTIIAIACLSLVVDGVIYAVYCAWLALQENVYLSRFSPYAWVLVDSELRSIDIPRSRITGYYSTVGDGPAHPAVGSTFQPRGGPT
jgi:hypothetical protein